MAPRGCAARSLLLTPVSLTQFIAPRHTRQSCQNPLQIHPGERETHRRDTETISATVQEGCCYACFGLGTETAWVCFLERYERGCEDIRDAADESLWWVISRFLFKC